MVENSIGASVIIKEHELDRFFDMLRFDDNDSSSQETFCGQE